MTVRLDSMCTSAGLVCDRYDRIYVEGASKQVNLGLGVIVGKHHLSQGMVAFIWGVSDFDHLWEAIA